MRTTSVLHKSKCGIFMNKNLTPMNNRVLASLRLIVSDRILKCWSFDGKMFARCKRETPRSNEGDQETENSFVKQIRYKDCNMAEKAEKQKSNVRVSYASTVEIGLKAPHGDSKK